MNKNSIALAALFAALCLVTQASAEWTGKKSNWKGFDRYDFNVDGRGCFVVVPKEPAEGKPWIWRARFPGYHSEVDEALVRNGFHIAHINTGGQFGSPASLDQWDKFYELLTTKHGLAKKPAIIAVSRGGLFAYRWAARNPEKVACIYADTPVCDFKSWPLGRGQGIGHKGTWQQLLKAYGLSEADALKWDKNPIDVLKPLADASIPLMHIVTEDDRVVPPNENTHVLAKRYKELGGSIVVTRVKNGKPKSNGHHFDMTAEQIATARNFIAKHAGAK